MSQNLAKESGEVHLPHTFGHESPQAAQPWVWRYVFPSSRLSIDPRTGVKRRHHVDESAVNREIVEVTKQTNLSKRITSQAFRVFFETRLLEGEYNMRTIQERFGHASVETTMIYTHVLNKGREGVISPLDSL